MNRFYYTKSVIYGWAIYDRKTNMPAYEASTQLEHMIKKDIDVTMLTEYQAMTNCYKLNKYIK